MQFHHPDAPLLLTRNRLAMSLSTKRPLAVTGIGVYSPLGRDPKELWEGISQAKCAVQQIKKFPTEELKVRHAAEIHAHDPAEHFATPEEQAMDWTSQFGVIAARQALEDAGLDSGLTTSEKVALVVGVCAGGQGTQKDESNPFDIALDQFPESSLYRQTDNIGQSLSLHGPRSTITTACASSGSALAYAFDLLQLGEVDAVLVGGTDAFSMSTYAGFYALGAMPEQPISPFSENTGVSFGEGAGFVVLERVEDAEARKARIHGLMLGYGCTGDAHHITAPHPSGEGLHRAMQAAVSRAGLDTAEVDYVNAHGTATRDNDRAESSAIRELFQGAENAPPVSSSKSQFGHTLGAAGVLEFIVSILGQKEQHLPPTVNFVAPRPGCDLDYVTNESRPSEWNTFLSNSAAFGGINVSVLGGSLAHRDRQYEEDCEDIWVTGVGVVSPIGSGADAFREALWQGRSGIAPVTEFDTSDCQSHHASLLGKFKSRKLAPTIDTRRTDPLNRYAMVAAYLAMQDAKLEVRPANSTRTGMVMALSYGSIAVQERFQNSLMLDGIEKLSAKHFPSMVVSTVGGTVSQSFGLRGHNASVAEGITGGLQGLIHATNTLRRSQDQDAIVVVAADEVASLFFRTYDQRGWLSPSSEGGSHSLGAYQSDAEGWTLGEGGVSLVLERESVARARGAVPLARMSGTGSAADALVMANGQATTNWSRHAVQHALHQSGLSTENIDLIFGHGRGQACHDRREIETLESLFGKQQTQLSCVMGNIGVASASCGLFSAAAGLLGIKHGEIYPAVGTNGDLVNSLSLVREPTKRILNNILIAGSTENGNHNAVVLSRVEN